MQDDNYDLIHIIEQLRSETPSEQPLIVTYVIKHFLKNQDNDDQNKETNNGYTFIRETNLLHINGDKSVYEQIEKIKRESFDTTIVSMDDFELVAIPKKAGSAWINSTHYMLIDCYDECGQTINESQKLTKIRYNELRKYNVDESKHRVEKLKIFFHFSQQFYALDIILKPESHKDSMWLKVYRTPGNKYMQKETDITLDDVDVPPCLKLLENVTSDPDFSSYSYSYSDSDSYSAV